MEKTSIKVAVIGCGNVGIAIAADLAMGGHEVTMIKTSDSHMEDFDRLAQSGNRVYLEENGTEKSADIKELSCTIEDVKFADVVILTIQSTYHKEVIKKMSRYLNSSQIVIVICSYLSSMYFAKYCSKNCPTVVETTGPYLEGRKIAFNRFKVGCRLTRSPLSVFQKERADKCMEIIHLLYEGFSNEYSTMESALLNPNMVLHTVGSIMSIPRIEKTHGDFCMYREAYARGNDATLQIMLAVDNEKRKVLGALGCKPIDVFQAGGFLGDPIESFYRYSQSEDRAISPTSVRSRYITEDVSQGLVLMESIANEIGVDVPVTSSLINIADAALGCNFRKIGRTIQSLDVCL